MRKGLYDFVEYVSQHSCAEHQPKIKAIKDELAKLKDLVGLNNSIQGCFFFFFPIHSTSFKERKKDEKLQLSLKREALNSANFCGGCRA